MSDHKIKDLDKLLRPYIGDKKTVVDSKLSPLTAPGENYGAKLLKADITLKNEDDSKEVLHAVAKLIPDDEMLREMFNIQVSCKVEIAFYDTMVPTLQKFQREKGVKEVMDFFPKMYAGRVNLNGSEKVDEDAVLLMENLAISGYKNVDRLESFDLPTTKLILKDLAAFHAVPVALKTLDPETFQSKIRCYLTESDPPTPPEHKDGPPMRPDELYYQILEKADECKALIPLLKGKLKKKLPEYKEPWCTVGHGDLWVNNIMVKFEEGKPVAQKFLDFQNPRYMSPAVDLFFLLWTSVQIDILDKHFDELVKFYYDNFIEQLLQLKCDTIAFTFDGMKEQMKLVSGTEIDHVLFMITFVILNKKANDSEPLKMPHEITLDDVTDLAKERIIFLVKAAKKHGWL